ncbi:hypothetical protein EDF46_0922 [Frondihabitans sp. PhB188]|uniref:hypothetical protein n=1 Tax=Frondihabitans sp. PhB188 TaxID=2485200 RepID=UPI000FAE112F|nr:hypothetical protein [Frondihabitans sp. PhB188]ROQ41541.1 hypothetical protein EDF46_0922 [Frondihabitans sp. PhB188]
MKALPWLMSLAGLAIVVLTYIDGAQLGIWADEHMTVSESLPNLVGPFVVAAIGFVLLAGGIAVGLTSRRTKSDR